MELIIDGKNYLLDQLLESSSRDLSSASFSWEHSTRLGDGFLTVSPKYSLGTDWFGGEENQSSDPTIPRAQFSKGTISGSYTHFLANELIFLVHFLVSGAMTPCMAQSELVLVANTRFEALKVNPYLEMKVITGVMT